MFHALISSLSRQDRGQGLVEYGLILGLVVVGAIVLLTTLGGNIGSQLSTIASAL